MNFDFWRSRWAEQRIGFHLPAVNPQLLRHGPQWLGFESWEVSRPLAGKRVLVPLCGKAVDLRWLAEQGARVVGVEFVEQAARAFFEEQGLPVSVSEADWGKRFCCQVPECTLEIWVTDFFRLTPERLGVVDAVYDRAALVAVDPERRPAYASQLAHLCPPSGRLLLITFDHDTGSGPPFSVNAAAVGALLGETFEMTLLEDSDLLAREPQFASRGASFGREQVWLGGRRTDRF